MKDELLIKYLLGEATVEETTQVESWFEEQSSNWTYYHHLQKLWEQSKMLEATADHLYDTEAEWQKLRIALAAETNNDEMTADENCNKSVELMNNRRPLMRLMNYWKWIAAAIIILLGCWVVVNKMQSTDRQIQTRLLTAAGDPVTDTLSDGSIITLNRYSSIKAPVKFNGGIREVALQDGEAFFNVVHLKKSPFIVHVGAIGVKVLGTSFNIKKNGNRTIIDVATGKVLVQYKAERLVLHADEKLSIDPTTKKLIRLPGQGVLYNYYYTKKFIANNTRLEDLVNILNEAYDRHIVFNRPELKDLRITTVFAKEPLELILQVISETFGIKVVYKKDSIELL